jgi:hypothetical protein
LICQVHFKDAAFGGVLRNLLAGDVDRQAVVGALRAVGYRGWISIVYLTLGDGLQSLYPYLLPAGQGDRDVAAVPDDRCPTACHAFFVLG